MSVMRTWDPDRVVPRICQAIVTRWGLPRGYEFDDYYQDVCVRLLANPHEPGRAKGRSFPSWAHLLARSVWINAVAKHDRRRRIAPMSSYEELIALGLL